MSETSKPISLTSQARSALKGAAHSLRPVVLIGDQGLTDAVLKEVDIALKAHELIKVRAGSQERDERVEILTRICDELGCAPVHHLGKTLIIYRPGIKGLYAVAAGHAVTPKPRITRKANEPHTPKKMAALGKKSVKKRAGTKPVKDSAVSQAGKPTIKAFSAERTSMDFKRSSTAKRPASAGKPGSRLRSPAQKSTRSAMSLRAGARRGAK
jgi:RNA-binding protein